MESVNVTKNEDIVTAAPVTATTADSQPEDKNAPSSTTKTESNAAAVENQSNESTNIPQENAVETITADISKNISSDSAFVEDSDLSTAMASVSISTSDSDILKQDQSESNVEQQQNHITATIENNTDNSHVSSDAPEEISLKPGEETESVVHDKFVEAHEYAEDEDDNVQRNQVSEDNLERVPDGGSCGEEELLEDNDADEEVTSESQNPAAADEVAVPVPVDDDTNDPQYIPRRGRFYEHDDRMAYSTTSSEESESDSVSEDSESDVGEEGSDPRSRRRRRAGSKTRKSITSIDAAEGVTEETANNTSSTKKVLAISKVAAADKSVVNTTNELAKKPGSKKHRDIDSIDKWTHDMYDEREQTRKTRDELLVSYGYDIREESEAPRARRHHKYGRAATAKYTRNWQDTNAYFGSGSKQQSSKLKRGSMGRRSIDGPNKNKNKSGNSDEYASEFPALNDSKPVDVNTAAESSVVTTASDQPRPQQKKSLPAHLPEKKAAVSAINTGPSKHAPSSKAAQKSSVSSGSHNSMSHHQEQQNGGPPSSRNKNYFSRPSADSFNSKEKSGPARDYPSPATNPNLFNRKSQHSSSNNQQQNYKQQHFNNSQGGQNHNHQNSMNSSGSRNFHQHHNNPQQYNRDRYFSKGSAPSPSSNSNQRYDQQHHHNVPPTNVGTGRTQHSGGHYHHYNNRQYENENRQIEQPSPPAPVVRSSKRYTVQSRRVLPDPVLNFGGMSKTPQPQQQPPISQHQQQSGLVMEQPQQSTIQQIQSQQQMQPAQQQLQQQQQIQQQQPLPMQLQQYHQPLQQMHPHHGMVLDHNTGMMVMAADPSLYQLYTSPQYAASGATGSATDGVDDSNAAAVAAAAALQMLAAQAAVFQPVPTGPAGVTPPPPGTQMFEQQQPDTFMTTYYPPQQQPQQQQQPPPPRRNLAIPIVAPPPEPNQQQGTQRASSLTPTPTQTTTSTN